MIQLEKEGRFFEDVEEDPVSDVIMPGEVDYLKKKISSKIKTKIAYKIARRFLNTNIKNRKIIIKDILGVEHLNSLNSGAVITCNHFNAMDSFAIQVAYERSNQEKRRFYRIIKEGNYTSYPGFFGFLMRHCYTLPLSSHPKALQEFIAATNQILQDGHFVLIYPEQSMWWNYRKPKPLKKTAFKFAVKNHVPVLPCFITMSDSDVLNEDGSYVQEYTIHMSKPIVAQDNLSDQENIDNMLSENTRIWKELYEKTYQQKLTYLCDNQSKLVNNI